ncbi:hypothetical protein BDK51DRAFT_53265 [Blyttiomyces helicus]|uniref:Uncharacterized protein n=1 Tax=Blyttiomyces helicus TaxID=388810 RepID=A0A4P9WMM7_9FUNG|nr:hypothetical protein BDK51DRAFT_53265 [Blyttiomyces helicus]|eukprot:RKO93742.1 hypothetical protein BDK51DRAFT_53265 [Blyttiomyces helicus]
MANIINYVQLQTFVNGLVNGIQLQAKTPGMQAARYSMDNQAKILANLTHSGSIFNTETFHRLCKEAGNYMQVPALDRRTNIAMFNCHLTDIAADWAGERTSPIAVNVAPSNMAYPADGSAHLHDYKSSIKSSNSVGHDLWDALTTFMATARELTLQSNVTNGARTATTPTSALRKTKAPMATGHSLAKAERMVAMAKGVAAVEAAGAGGVRDTPNTTNIDLSSIKYTNTAKSSKCINLPSHQSKPLPVPNSSSTVAFKLILFTSLSTTPTILLPSPMTWSAAAEPRKPAHVILSTSTSQPVARPPASTTLREATSPSEIQPLGTPSYSPPLPSVSPPSTRTSLPSTSPNKSNPLIPSALTSTLEQASGLSSNPPAPTSLVNMPL